MARLPRRIRDRTAARVVKFGALAVANPRSRSRARCKIWRACRRESEIAQRRALLDLVRVLRRMRDRTAARVVKFGALAAASPRSRSGARCEIWCFFAANPKSQRGALCQIWCACYVYILKSDPIRLHRYCVRPISKARHQAMFERSNGHDIQQCFTLV